ncbi:hypothetical protein NL50_12265 [Clostridium acetobutylicum]|nr:hypothetical protein NL50_12265 [Clostridium acetobutylicum]
MDRKFAEKINLLVILFVASIVVIYNKLNYMYNILIVAIICLVYLSYLIQNSYNKIFFKTKEFFLVVLLTISCMISTFYNFNILGLEKILIIFLPLMISIIIVLLHGYKYLLKFLKVSLNIIMIFNLFGIYEILTKQNVFFRFLNEGLQGDKISFQTTYGYDEFRVYSVFGHPIIFGNILVVFFWVCIILERNMYKKVIFSIIILLNLYFTKSRSSWLAFVGILILYCINRIIYNKRHNKVLKIKINYIFISNFTAIICGFLLYKSGVIRKIYDRFMIIQLGDGSKIQRVVTMGNIISNWVNSNLFVKLFGNGYDTVKDFMMNNQVLMQGFQYTDNQYMTMLYEFGIISVVVYLIILFLCVKRMILSENKFEMLVIIIFIGISINMFFYECFAWKPIIMLLILSLSLLCLRVEDINSKI